MESNNGHRSGLLTAGGILSIISGAFEVVGGGALVGLMLSPAVRRALFNPIHSGFFVVGPASAASSTRLIIVGVSLLVLGAIAIAGGVSATRRKSFGLSLAAAICALPSVIFGLSSLMVIPGLLYLTSVIMQLRLAGHIFCALPSVVFGTLAVIFVALGRREFGAKMGSDGDRSGLVTAGGILSIIVGTFEVVGGGALVGLMLSPAVRRTLLPPSALALWPHLWPGMTTWLIGAGVPLLVLGIISIVGGVSATRRKSFGLSLAAAICALPSVIFGLSLAGVIPALSSLYSAITSLGRGTAIFSTSPSVILGILAVIFVALGKREFGAKVAQNATSLTERSTVFPARV